MPCPPLQQPLATFCTRFGNPGLQDWHPCLSRPQSPALVVFLALLFVALQPCSTALPSMTSTSNRHRQVTAQLNSFAPIYFAITYPLAVTPQETNYGVLPLPTPPSSVALPPGIPPAYHRPHHITRPPSLANSSSPSRLYSRVDYPSTVLCRHAFPNTLALAKSD